MVIRNFKFSSNDAYSAMFYVVVTVLEKRRW